MFDRVPAVDCYCFDWSCTMCTSPIVHFQCKRIKRLNTVQCLNHANTQNWFHPRIVSAGRAELNFVEGVHRSSGKGADLHPTPGKIIYHFIFVQQERKKNKHVLTCPWQTCLCAQPSSSKCLTLPNLQTWRSAGWGNRMRPIFPNLTPVGSCHMELTQARTRTLRVEGDGTFHAQQDLCLGPKITQSRIPGGESGHLTWRQMTISTNDNFTASFTPCHVVSIVPVKTADALPFKHVPVPSCQHVWCTPVSCWHSKRSHVL